MANAELTSENEKVVDYHKRITSLPGKSLERTTLMAEYFNYLATTKHILEADSDLRSNIVTLIKDFSVAPPEHKAIIQEALTKLCSKMEEYEPEKLRGCAYPDPIANKGYTPIGAGSFGVVFQPALPNLVGDELKNYPENVTKVFYKQKSYDDLMETYKVVPEMYNHNEGHRINTYTKKYKVWNLPPRMRNILRAYKPNIVGSSDLYTVRMPNLGKDVTEIKSFYPKLRQVPFSTILKQIQKLIHQNASAAGRGYGHFDIRDKNLMIHPETGVVTMIDFDWLKPYDYLYNHYGGFGFYNNPPEAFFIRYMDSLFPGINNGNAFQIVAGYLLKQPFRSETLLNKMFKNYLIQMFQSFGAGLAAFVASGDLDKYVLRHIASNLLYLKTQRKLFANEYELLKTHFFPYVDNFGLALTILQVLAFVYPMNYAAVKQNEENFIAVMKNLQMRISNRGTPYNDEEVERILRTLIKTIDLLTKMASFSIEGRLTPAQAASAIDQIVEEFSAPNRAEATREAERLAVLAKPEFLRPNAIPNNARAELNRLAVMKGGPPKERRRLRKTRKLRK